MTEMWLGCGEGPGWADEPQGCEGIPFSCILPSPGEPALGSPAPLTSTLRLETEFTPSAPAHSPLYPAAVTRVFISGLLGKKKKK